MPLSRGKKTTFFLEKKRDMWVGLVVIKVTMQTTSAGWIVNLPVFEIMCAVLRH